VTSGVLAACGLLFGLAGVHVLLAEGQFRLAHLQHKADDAQAGYVRLRLQVAQLESPERIVAEAQERLGMVAPTSLTYLTPAGPVTAAHAGPAAPSGATSGATLATATPAAPATGPTARAHAPADTTQGWAAAKPVLANHP
jgi:hypothetical protein